MCEILECISSKIFELQEECKDLDPEVTKLAMNKWLQGLASSGAELVETTPEYLISNED